MEFDWDSRKDAVNRGKHGVSFAHLPKLNEHFLIPDELSRLTPSTAPNKKDGTFALAKWMKG